MKLAPHLHRLGNDIVASYLIDLPEGITLVVAGLPGHWRDLQRELDALGRPLSDIRGLVLTHGDGVSRSVAALLLAMSVSSWSVVLPAAATAPISGTLIRPVLSPASW